MLIRTVCKPGDHVVIPNDAYGGTYRLFAKVAERWGLTWTAGAGQRPRRGPGRDHAGHEDRLDRDADQPAAEHRRHRRARGRRARRRRAARGRQHVRVALPAAAARARRRRRGALDDEVRRRSLRCGRWRAGRATTTSWAPRLAYHQNAMGAINGPFDAWLTLRGHQDARRTDGSALRQRRARRRLPGQSPEGRERALSRACPTTRATRSRPSRCAGSVAWSVSGRPAARRPRSTSAIGQSCSFWANRSAASSR